MDFSAEQETTLEKHFTIDEARRFGGLSHNDVSWLLREAHWFQRQIPRHRLGDFVVRRAMESWAQFPRGEHARKWLREHPEVGQYREVTDVEWARYERKTNVHFPGTAV